MRTILLLILLAWGGAARAEGPALAPTGGAADVDPRSALIGSLSWIDSKPDPDLYEANEALWFPLLLQLVDDPVVAPYVQRRALLALQHYDRPEALELFEAIAGDRAREPRLRGRAVRCLALRQGRAALPRLQQLLADPEPRVREDTLRALAALGVPGRDPIRGHLEREPEPRLRELGRRLLGPDVAPTPGSGYNGGVDLPR